MIVRLARGKGYLIDVQVRSFPDQLPAITIYPLDGEEILLKVDAFFLHG
jgi:hypothetical protein